MSRGRRENRQKPQVRWNPCVGTAADLDRAEDVRLQNSADAEREWEACVTGAPEDRCKKLLRFLNEREKKVLARLAPAMTDTTVNLDRLNAEMTACYGQNNTYTHLIDCLMLCRLTGGSICCLFLELLNFDGLPGIAGGTLALA